MVFTVTACIPIFQQLEFDGMLRSAFSRACVGNRGANTAISADSKISATRQTKVDTWDQKHETERRSPKIYFSPKRHYAKEVLYSSLIDASNRANIIEKTLWCGHNTHDTLCSQAQTVWPFTCWPFRTCNSSRCWLTNARDWMTQYFAWPSPCFMASRE